MKTWTMGTVKTRATEARAVARQLDLSGGRPLKILDSTDLKGVDPELLGGLAQETHVFARVTPTHKLEIVQALQNRGRVVGIMTSTAYAAGPVGFLLAGPIVDAYGVQTAFLGILVGYAVGVTLSLLMDVTFFMGQGHVVHRPP